MPTVLVWLVLALILGGSGVAYVTHTHQAEAPPISEVEVVPQPTPEVAPPVAVKTDVAPRPATTVEVPVPPTQTPVSIPPVPTKPAPVAPATATNTYENTAYNYAIAFPEGWTRSLSPFLKEQGWHAYASSARTGQAEIGTTVVPLSSIGCSEVDMCIARFLITFALHGYGYGGEGVEGATNLIYVDGYEGRLLESTYDEGTLVRNRHLLQLFVIKGSMLYVVNANTDTAGLSNMPLIRAALDSFTFTK
jgi:hypothetical protein